MRRKLIMRLRAGPNNRPKLTVTITGRLSLDFVVLPSLTGLRFSECGEM